VLVLCLYLSITDKVKDPKTKISRGRVLCGLWPYTYIFETSLDMAWRHKFPTNFNYKRIKILAFHTTSFFKGTEFDHVNNYSYQWKRSIFFVFMNFRHFGLETFGSLSHSMGSPLSALYALTYRSPVNFCIALDLSCFPYNPFQERIFHIGRRIDKVYQHTYLKI